MLYAPLALLLVNRMRVDAQHDVRVRRAPR
jgi:hypothetical protein